MSSSSEPGILLDTNILIYSASKPFNIGNEMSRLGYRKIYVPSFVIEELKSIGQSKDKRGRFARLAIEIARGFSWLDADAEGKDVDEKILNLAKEKGFAVATADSHLRRALLKSGVRTFLLKDRRLIPAEG